MSSYFFEQKWFITFDGPSHVGNARIMADLLSGGTGHVSEYFQFTDFPQPNWTGHFVMMVFSFFLDGASAEKMTLLTLLLSMVFSFRYVLRAFMEQTGLLPLLILPVTFGMFLYSGSYNYCFSIVFLFWSIGYLQRHLHHLHWKHAPVILLLSAGTYFSHLSALPVLAMVSGLMLIMELKKRYRFFSAEYNRQFLKDALILLVAHLPFIVLVYLYQKTFGSNNYFYLPKAEVFRFMYDGQPLVAWGKTDLPYTRAFVALLYGAAVFTVFLRLFKRDKSVAFFRYSDVFFIGAMVLVVLIFWLPDSDTKGGMVTTRLITFHYLFLLLWLCMHRIQKWVTWVMPMLVFGLVFSFVAKHVPEMEYMRKVANDVSGASKFIRPGDVVLPLNRGGHWLTINLPQLLGADKPVVVVENYESWHGYFPVSDAVGTPCPSFPPRSRDWLCSDVLKRLNNGTFRPEHIFYLEQDHHFPCEADLQLFIERYYELKYSSQFCSLYSIKSL
jgi:hypothetical protein